MESWFLIISSLCIVAILKALLDLIFPRNKHSPNLPPGPPVFPFIGNALWLRKSSSQLQLLRHKYGAMLTLHIGSRPAIFISDHSLAHQALVTHGAVFADRPSLSSTAEIYTSNQHTISSAGYGQTWRVLRRNITTQILSLPRIRSYSPARKWVLNILKNRLAAESGIGGEPVRLVDHFRYAMFCLSAIVCFGDKLDEDRIREIDGLERELQSALVNFNVLNVWPSVTRVLFYKLWGKFLKTRQRQENMFIPLIRARRNMGNHGDDQFNLSYVDSLLELQLPEEKRGLTESEMVSLCSEFLNAGTDTTSTALQWIMANLVKHPDVQEKLFMEIKGVAGEEEKEEIGEDDLQNMPYLKAVVLEGLRRHPPVHILVPHRVTRDFLLNGYLLPKKSSLHFMVSAIGLDPKLWEDPMAFRPERFLDGEEPVDITGRRGIKMMPFGAGRRACPGSGLAVLYLEYFVANLVWSFEWKAAGEDGVDLSEKTMFTTAMKTPLEVHLFSRSTKL
ncbi:hypothetical protein GQ457_09G026970 [Hibiscus cannabinus]